ncbi:hypothetical protein [Methanobrevibacter curvatus]|uniref:Uncharacterized protein n=1 Tax=Methanobrevibacter curvatus TaxID=49547 RepID=A0A166BDQ4_9EURY|nr:hypothetical protein [Methanobrevibacter curvatus]KZX13194.1 hypothetical protein MBCUR_07210 [Methanobrevibacter curvatus]
MNYKKNYVESNIFKKRTWVDEFSTKNYDLRGIYSLIFILGMLISCVLITVATTSTGIVV